MTISAIYHQKDKREEGVTLLLAILIMSSILAISFSVATILFIEVRTSADLVRTEPAYYAAHAVSEEALFKLKRQVPDETLSYSNSIHAGNNLVALTATTTPLSETQYRDIVRPTSRDLYNTTNRYPFFDVTADDPYASGSSYGRIKVTYLNTGSYDRLQIYVCEFDPGATATQNLCATPSGPWECQETLYMSGTSYDCPVHPNKQQELILYNATQDPTQNIYVQIEAFASDSITPKGIPYFNKTVVEINAANGEVNRRIRTIVPNY